MLTDAVEIQIISKARQANVRDHRRSRKHFDRIFADFLSKLDLRETRVLDLGPGQYDFGVLARERGAEAWGIDNDPAVLELGRYKRFPVVSGDIKRITSEMFPVRFDGLFCKFSLNAFWFAPDEERVRQHVHALCSLLNPQAWGWVAPWNGLPKTLQLADEAAQRILLAQRDALSECGFECRTFSDEEAKYYGVHGDVANSVVFLRNLHGEVTT